MTITFEHHVEYNPLSDDKASTALVILFDSLEKTDHVLSKAQLKEAISKGALWLTRGKHTQRLRRVKKTLQSGDQLHFYYNSDVLAIKVPDATLISDEIDYSVWYKPYGMLSQGSKWSDHCTINRFTEQYFTPERAAFIVHRLDRAATGLILIAHSKKAAQAFSQIFEHHQLEKIYHIIVHGILPKNIDENNALEITSNIDNKKAKSTFYPKEVNAEKRLSLIRVQIETGRKHQIRKHAASVNLPVVGDRLHGERAIKLPEEVNLQLCAVSLKFACPFSQEEKIFELPTQLILSLTELSKKLT